MTIETYGTGAIASPPDPRDWPVSLALAEAGPVSVPSKYAIKPVPPNLNQGDKPWCVAYAASGQRMYQQYLDHKEWRDFDESWLYARCKERDGIPGIDGTYIRVALDVLKKMGVPTVGHSDSGKNKIAAYYSVPLTPAAFRETLVKRGAIPFSMAWYWSWFDSRSDGNLAAPSGPEYGHAVLATGYDDAHVCLNGTKGAVLVRNSWSRGWASLGNFWLPYTYLPRYAWDAWWAKDATEI